MALDPTNRDFFLSYTSKDKQWAEWIADVLEGEGYSTFIQAWDFRPGSNFVLEMQRAASHAERTIAVLSNNYLGALYTQPEWASAFAIDPTGEHQTFIPIRVDDCEPTELLKSVVHLDLFQLGPDTARQALLEGVRPGRSKPTQAPIFPGPSDDQVSAPGESGNYHSVEDWRRRRASLISMNKGVKILSGQTVRILSLVPLSGPYAVSIPDLKGQIVNLPPLYSSGYDYEIVHTGIVTLSQFSREQRPHGYVHLSRDLKIEAVDTGLFHPRGDKFNGIASTKFEEDAIRNTSIYLSTLHRLGVEGPVAISVSLVNIEGYHLYYHPLNPGPLDVNELFFPVVVVNDVNNSSPPEVERVLRPVFDYLWNAFGIERSPNYNSEGIWKPR